MVSDYASLVKRADGSQGKLRWSLLLVFLSYLVVCYQLGGFAYGYLVLVPVSISLQLSCD